MSSDDSNIDIFSKRPNIISSNCICEIFIQHKFKCIDYSVKYNWEFNFLILKNIDVTLHCMLDYPNIFLGDGGKKEINIRIACAAKTMRSVKI